MDLRQLHALLAVAEHRSFSAAARALHTVQSNVSTHVARLERELQTVLVDRKTMELTPEGSAVVERARRIQSELQAISDDVVSLRDEVSGVTRVGLIGTTGRWLLPHLLAEMEAQVPGVQLIVVDATTTSLTPQLTGGQLDLAVLQLPVADPDVAVEPLFDEERILIVPADHPLAANDVVAVDALAEHPLLLPPKGTSFRDAIESEATAAEVEIDAMAEVDGMRLLASLAFGGYGPALLPASAAPNATETGWRRVHISGLSRREVGLGIPKRTSLSAPARAVRSVIRTLVGRHGANQPGLHLTLDSDAA